MILSSGGAIFKFPGDCGMRLSFPLPAIGVGAIN